MANFHRKAATHVYDNPARKTLSQQGNGTKAAYDAANRENSIVNLSSTNITLPHFIRAFARIRDRTSI